MNRRKLKTCSSIVEMIKDITGDDKYAAELQQDFDNHRVSAYLQGLRCKHSLREKDVARQAGWSLKELQRIESASNDGITGLEVYSYITAVDKCLLKETSQS